MASRGLRNKSTRLSSPATFTAKEPVSVPEPASRAREDQRTLDTWMEPPLRHPAPSFEDNKGLERVGVLEHMEPLGRPPTQKLLQRLKLFPPKPSHRSTPFQSEEVTTPTTDIERAETASPAESLPQPVSVKAEDQVMRVKPEDPTRRIKAEEQAMRSRSTRTRSGNGDNDEYKPGSLVPSSPVKHVTAQTSLSKGNTPSSASPQRSIPAEDIKIHVEAAINEAESTNSPGLIPGLRKLCEDANSDPALWTVLDAVLHKTPSHKQFRTFRRYIHSGLAQHSASPTSITPLNLQPQVNENRVASTPTRALPSSRNLPNSASRSASGLLSPVSVAPLPFHIQRPQPRLDSPSMSPTTTEPAIGSAGASNGGAQNPTVGATEESLGGPNRSRSVSTSSSLSSAKSLDAETFAPTIEMDGEPQINGSKAAKSATQRQATNRVAAGNNNTKTRTVVSSLPKDPYADFSTTAKLTTNRLKRSKIESEIDPEEVQRQKHEFLDRSVHDYDLIPRPESDERTIVVPDNLGPYIASKTVPPPVIHPHHVNPASALFSSPVGASASSEHVLRNGTSRKRSRNEHEEDEEAVRTPASSSPPPFLTVPPPGAAHSSRAGTPRFAKLPPAKKVKKSARVMVSPNKAKNGGITAGIARAGTGKDSANGNGVDDSEEENNEYCAACGGYGELLCCDGCPNAFHGTCLDPPMDTDNPPDVQWYCPRCVARQSWGQVETRGIMGRIVRRVEEINPKAFTLPFELREYFEGVKTGDEGEYEEVSLPRTQNTNPVKMNRAGFIEEPNYKDLRDSKNNIIVCYRCHLTSNGRDIIPCDYCPARWHLDCLDPPLAVPPRRRKDNPNATWRCPLHIENDLATMDRTDTAAPGELGRMPRLRKPRNAIPYDVGLTRGFRNNGLIDVDLMKDEEPNLKEVEMMGTVFRLPEKGIRLDFIDRVKRSWYEDQTFPEHLHARKRLRSHLYRPSPDLAEVGRYPSNFHLSEYMDIDKQAADFYPSRPRTALASADVQANAKLRAKSFAEQEAVLSLRRLSENDENIPSDKLVELTNALIYEAPPTVQRAVQRDEVTTLVQLQGLIKRRLAIVAREENVQGVNGNHSSKPSIDLDDSMDEIA